MARFQGIPLDQAPIEQAPSMAAPRAPRFRGTPLEGPKPVAAPAPVAALAPPPIAEAPAAPSEMPDINPPSMPQAAPQPAAGGLGAQIMRFGKDAGASVVAGTGSIMQFPGQVYGLATGDFDTMSTRGGEAVRQFGQSLKSPELQEKERQAQAVIAEAEKDGFGAEVGAVLKTYLSDPVLLANFTVEQLPSLLATMGFGKLAQWGTQVAAKVAQRGAVSAGTLSRAGQAGAITGGAAMQGASVGDETRDAILRLPDATFAASPAFQALVASGIDPQAAKEQLALEGARLAGAAGAGISGATATLLPGAERMAFGQGSTQGIIRRVLTGGAAEGLQEGLEEGGGRFAQNVAVQQIDPDQSLLQGVGAQGTMGALPGAVTGAGVAALSGGPSAEAPVPPPAAPAERIEPTFDAPTQPPPPPNPRAEARFGTGDTVLQPAPLSTPRSRSDLAADLADPRPIAEIDAERQQRAREQQVQLASQYGYPAIGSAFTFTLPDGETVQGVMEGVQQTSTEGLARIRGADGQMYVLGADEFTVTEGTGDRADPVVVKTAKDVDIAAQQVEAPTPAQAEAGNYKHAHLEWEGFDIAIETPKGGTRSGVGKDGKPWSVTMPEHYGRIKGTIGADGDQIDITIGPNPEQNGVVWVIDQIDPDTGKFDEHKIMAGFEMGEEAEQAYIDGFSDGRGIDRIGAVERMDLAQLRQWIANGNTKKALAYNGTPKYREYRIPAPAQAPGDNYRGGQRGPAFDLPASQPAPAAEPPQAPAEGAPSRESGAAASEDADEANAERIETKGKGYSAAILVAQNADGTWSAGDEHEIAGFSGGGGGINTTTRFQTREQAIEAGAKRLLRILPGGSPNAKQAAHRETLMAWAQSYTAPPAAADDGGYDPAKPVQRTPRRPAEVPEHLVNSVGGKPLDDNLFVGVVATLRAHPELIVPFDGNAGLTRWTVTLPSRQSAELSAVGDTVYFESISERPAPGAKGWLGNSESKGVHSQFARALIAHGKALDAAAPQKAPEPVTFEVKSLETGKTSELTVPANPPARNLDMDRAAFKGALEKTGAARYGGADYVIAEGPNGGFYFRRTKDGNRIEKGAGYPGKWAREEAIRRATLEAFSDTTSRTDAIDTAPEPSRAPPVIDDRERQRQENVRKMQEREEAPRPNDAFFNNKQELVDYLTDRLPKGYEVDRGGDGPGSPVRLFGPGDKLIDEWVGAPDRARIDKVIERAKKAAADAAKPAPSPKPAEPDMLPAQAENEDVVQPSAVPSSPAGPEPGASAGTAPQRADVEAPRGQGEGVRGDGARGDGERRPERREPRTDDPRAGASGDVRPADPAVADKRPDAEVKGENHVIEAGALGESRPWRQKALDNIRAIELMRQIEAEGRPATKAEQAELARYVGWGGIRNAFPDAQGAYGKGFETIGKKLRELLSDTEYKTAQRSIQYAHYTSETIVREMWRAAQQLGFKGGKVFEPGMGVGNFAGMMPTDVSAASTYHGLELDHTTARIARLLYPRFGIRQDDFTKAPIPADTYDLAIGNPPFADVAIKSDPAYAKHAFLLHDYFFAKSLDAVRPGGLLMFVTSAGTLNKIDTAAREYMADRADFVGAIRLPGDAFEKNAGTSVTTDIIILRKRLPGETAGSRAWTETVERTLPNKDGAKQSGAVNRWISENPEMVLGDEGFFDKLYPGRYGVRSSEGDFAPKLKKAVDALPADVLTPWQESQAERAEVDFGTKERKDGSFYLDASGRLMQMRDRVGQPVPQRGKGATGGKTGAEMARIKKLVPIRDALRAVLDADLSEDSANATKARKRLNAAYDEFVSEFGPINKAELSERRPSVVQQESARSDAREEARFNGLPFDEGTFDPRQMIAQGKSLAEIARARNAMREEYAKAGKTFDEGTFDPDDMPDIIIDKRPNVDAFMDDPESYRLRAIEDYNDNTGEAKKRPIFERNIITREKEPEIKSVNDALLYVLNRRGRVAIDEIAAAVNITVPQAIEQLGDRIFKLPGTQDAYETRDAYLSGNVRKKLLEAQAAAERNPEFKPNVEALEAVQPTPLPPSEISANLGMPWLPTDVIESFGAEIGLTKLKVGYLPALASWNVSGDDSSSAARTEWGTAERSAPELISDALNRQDVKIYDEVRNPDGSKSRVLNTVATQAAQDKLQAIKAKFSEWVWSDAARADRLATLYNDNYNNLVVRQYDGDYLTTPGIAAGWSWRPHQKRAIARIIQSGNTYLAHAVGAGKTSEMIGAIMEQRRLGLVRKAMVAVPNHMLGQFTKEFYEQYPTVKIAVADERQFHTDRRKQFVANVANDDLDAIVITHSAMGLIPVSPEFQDALIQEQIDNFRDLLSELDKTDRITRRRIENAIERLEQRLLGKAKKQDQVYTFEQMGVDQLFVDEAHLFRKLDFATKMSGVKGISPEGSKAAFDLYVKARYLETINPGRSLVLASGTPVTNTMAELYTVSRYMQPQELAERGLSHFDAWAAAFGDMATELEQDAAGGYKPVTRFAQFVNIPELSAMVRQQMDVVTSNQLEQYVVRPKIKGGRRELHMSEKSPELADYQEQLAGRMKAIANRKGPPKPGDDIILSVINDGRHAAIDMRLVNPDLPADPTSKLSRMIDRVFDIWQKTKRQPLHKAEGGKYTEKPVDYGPATQMIFANLGIGGSRPFNVHTYIVNELARRGVPRAEIAQIADFKTHVAKQRLFNDMNEGKVRVLIGSTAKMATGVNAQRRLYALHNLDPLWYPADDEQRNGRALRQGNMNPEIEINDYSTKGTYDSTMWGMMARKAGFIQGFFEGDKSIRSIEDLGEASLYEQAKALTTNDPRLIQLTETKQELEKARRRRSAFESEVWSVKEKIAGANRSIAYAKRRIPDVERDIAQRVETKGDAFKGTVNGKKFDERPEFGNALLAQINDIAELESPTKAKKIAEVGGFPVMASSQKAWGAKPGDPWKVSLYLDRNGDFQTDIAESESALGLVRSIEYALEKFESERDGYQNNIAAAERTIKDYTPKLEKKFDGDAKIKELSEKLARLEADINADAKARDAATAAQQAAAKAEDESGKEMQSLRNTGRARNGEKVKLGAPIVDRRLDALRATLYADLRAELDRIALTDVALNLPDYIARGDGKGGVQYSAGRQRFWGDAQVLIEIALTESGGNQVDVDPTLTLHHEAVHAMKRLNLFSPAEWKVLAAKSEAVWVNEFGLVDKDSGYKNLPKNLILEEGIARAYEAWKEGQEGAVKGGLIARAFAKIKRFIEAIGNVFRGRGFNTVEGLFEKIDFGEIGARGRMAKGAYHSNPRKNFKPMYADTSAFKLWFGASKVVDASGKPLVVYHGTQSDINAFVTSRPSPSGINTWHGAYFSPSPSLASSYASQPGRSAGDAVAGPNVMPVYLSIKNPKIIRNFAAAGPLQRIINFLKGVNAPTEKEMRSSMVVNDADLAKLKAQGYDGIMNYAKNEFVVFDPTQIKSATGNRGTFDPDDDNIMYSLLPKDQASPAESERMAELAGEEIVSGTERDFVNDAGLVKRWVVHPRTIAAYDKDFVPVYRAAVRQFETRDEFAAEIARKAQAYTDLTPEDRAQVDKLLELGRLEGTVYGDAALKDGVTNDPEANEGRTENAVLTKPGETVTLTDRQIEGYKAARASMNTALDLFKAQIIEEWGYDPTEIRSSADILALITEETSDKDAEQHKDAAKIVREIEQAQRTGYVPFTRWGQIGIAVRRADSRQMALGIDGEASRPYTTIHYEMIEVDGAVSRLMRAARKLKGRKTAEQLGQFPEVKARLDALKAKYEGDPDVRFNVFQVGDGGPLEQGVKLSDLDMLAEVGRIDDKAWEQVREQLEKAIKMRGFRKHFFGSKNLPGYSVDFERAIADYTIGIAGYLARRKYGSIWDGAIGKIPTTKPKLREYAQKYRDYTQSPQEELQMLRQLGFIYYLAGSPASALVNMSQVPLVTVPWLSQFAAGPKVMYHVTKAYKDALAMTTASRGMDVFDPAKAPDDVREAFQKAWDEGFFVPLNTWEMMGTAQARSQVVRRLSKVSRTAVDAIALMFTVAERLNRMVTWIAAYRLGKQETVRQAARTILAKNALARSDELLRGYTPEKFAGFAIDETQLRMGKVNRPAMMRGAGAAIFQFKGFVMQMIELQIRMGTQYQGKRSKVAVASMILLLMLTAGIWGAPFGEDLRDILEFLHRKLKGTDLDLDTELRELVVELTGSPGLAEAISRGAPRAAGVDLQRIGMGNILPGDAVDVGGIPLDLTVGRLSQAIEHAKRGDWALATAELLPTFIKNPIVGVSWGTEGVRSQASGRVVIPPEKVTYGDVALKAAGFTPADIANQRESERAQTRANTATKEVKDRFIGELARLRADILRADTANDAAKSRALEERFARTLDEIRAFNEGRPLHEMVIVNPKTLKDRVKEELQGAEVRDKNAPKQARPRREEIERIYGEQPR
jgi:N12 class adenine-specific DNA methylase